jgi:hypothetical protein
MINLQQLLLEDPQDTVREAIFTARQLYHTLFNPEGKRDYSYPGGYATIVKFTKAIQEDRPKKSGSAVPVAPAKAKAGVSRPLMYFQRS